MGSGRLALFLPRSTPFYRALWPQMARGFREAGFQVQGGEKLLDEAEMVRFCRSFQPDVVFEMNRTRREAPFLPADVRHVAWIVDFQGRRDEAIQGSELTYLFDPYWRQVFRFGSFVDWLPPGSCAQSYRPGGVSHACDVSFIGHIPRPWSALELARNVSRSQVVLRFEQLLRLYLHQRRVAHFVGRDAEGSWDHARYWRFANNLARERTGQPLVDDPVVAYDLLGRVPRMGIRQAMLAEARELTDSLRIWGTDSWQQWPEFAPFYQGLLEAPEDLRQAYAGSRINLHEGVGMHFRALDCLASGGLLFYATETKSGERRGGWGWPLDLWGYGEIDSVPRAGRHYVEYYPGELAELGRFYLDHPDQADRIRAAAHEEVAQHHTWFHRARKVARDLAYVEGRRPGRPRPRPEEGDPMNPFASSRSPREGETCVFYISSHGSAGDHWFDWLARALNAHPDLFIYMGESVRSKYLKERSRKERPDLLAFTEFLTDLGKPYQAIGECYAYRAYQLEALAPVHGDRVRFVNVVRHPYCWLSAYVSWRCTNMGMPPGQTLSVDHEWNVTRHDEFKALGLQPYTREQIDVWASLQGMHILNRMISDAAPGVHNVRLEKLVEDRDTLNETIGLLTHGRVKFERPLLDLIYGWTQTPFRVGGRVLDDPAKERAAWPEWKVRAFGKLVEPRVRRMFEGFGYDLGPDGTRGQARPGGEAHPG
jgi:hypothetical protein